MSNSDRCPSPPQQSKRPFDVQEHCGLLDENHDKQCEKEEEQQLESIRQAQKNKSSNVEMCLQDWWFKYTELKEYPHQDKNELIKLPKSVLLKYLYRSEMFRETYGDAGVPLEERMKRKKHEAALQMPHQQYKKSYDREKFYDPKKPARFNKRRRISEHFETFSHTWTSKHDYKPCGCSKCIPPYDSDEDPPMPT